METETKIRKVETITFQDPDKEFNLRRKRAPSVAMETKSHAATAVELDAKKTRYEIMKFATNSMETGEKLQAEERIVVELGGRRGKNANINYKLLLERRKREKEIQENKKESLRKPIFKKTSTKKSKIKRPRK